MKSDREGLSEEQLFYDRWCRETAKISKSGGTLRVVDIHELVRKVIDNDLSETEREMALMFFYEKMSVSEIAAETRTSRNNVYRTLDRAKEKVRLVIKHITDCPFYEETTMLII